jgi:DNA mismatch repair protein MutL
MPIALLTEETIGKIAAGEVVERPSSVVKELLENALDADSTSISIEIRNGGIDLIEINDNGSGMTAEELPFALQRHATSKLTSFEDLDRLNTLGFRGEALPSIAAVSDLTIRTKSGSSPTGCEVKVDFGRTGPVKITSAPAGTRISVRDLFANVPARKKFLRQPSTEAAYIQRTASAYATANPHVQFTLTIDRRRAIATDGSGSLSAAAAGAFGVDVGRAVIEVPDPDEIAMVPGVAVTGWIDSPEVTRSHRQDMFFFVNGRWIQNRALSFALEEAYHSLLMVGRHPIVSMCIEVDPAAVDVNVHPTKAEVKFVDERAVCRAVQRAAHAALSSARRDQLPSIQFRPIANSERQREIAFQSNQFMARRAEEPSKPDEHAPQQNEGHRSGVPILRVLGQVAATYIIAEGPEGMYLIDQHAAHERVMYEKILSQLANQSVDRQPLLDPLIVDLSPDQLGAFDRSRDELKEIGFEIEAFGNGSVAIREVPAVVGNVDIGKRLQRILQELAEGGAGTSWLDSVAVSAACHTSIRAGQALSLAEMRELIAALERTSQPRACGHGRPTMLHMTQTDLEKQFSRR